MLPLTILAVQKFANLLLTGNALQNQISAMAQSGNTSIPPISPGQIVLSSASPELADKAVELTYPRVCLYSAGVRNTHLEKFRSISGFIGAIAEIWSSGNRVDETDQWIHYYVEAISSLLQGSVGDWKDGIFYSGSYDVAFRPPLVGGLGYVTSAKLTCNLTVSRS